jgi:competence protein ComEA
MLERFKNLIFSAVVIAIVVGAIVLITYRPPPVVITVIPPAPTPTPRPSATPGPLHVYVTGAVLHPNTIYVLPRGSRATDAVSAAGGFLAEADQSRVNLAQVLNDGDQVHVPAVGEIRAEAKPTELPPASASNPVQINTATAKQLERLPGVGPSLAKAIIDWREKNGPFRSMADLDDVPGIGEARLKQWEELIVFD